MPVSPDGRAVAVIASVALRAATAYEVLYAMIGAASLLPLQMSGSVTLPACPWRSQRLAPAREVIPWSSRRIAP